MSSIGTGVATSVAAVSQNAQQAAKARDKGKSDVNRLAHDNADRFEQQLQSAAQADDPDAELPDHQAPGYQQLYAQDDQGEAIAQTQNPEAEQAAESMPATPAPPPGDPLYQHLDIKA